ncbi:hypothetical protein VNO77_04731 [Canavalia gladiata]|uniref:BHLH domain-containing protein n=1 Tax=Canavalia gladiata TaxID=3824 RepID=A0AAN9RDH6_CANGL
MDLCVGDHGSHDLDFLWENQSWGPSNSDNSGESKENMKPPNQSEKGNVADQALMNKKRNREIGSGNKEKNIAIGEGKDGKCREFDHETHIRTERERRKKMRNMFASLHALLPQLPFKALVRAHENIQFLTCATYALQANSPYCNPLWLKGIFRDCLEYKSTIVDEGVKYIKNLQQTLKMLEKQKEERVQRASTFGCESSMMNSQWQYPYDSSREGFITDEGSSNNLHSNAMLMDTPNALSNPQDQPAPTVAFQTWTSPNVVLNMYGDQAQFCICAAKKPNLLTAIAFVLDKYKIEIMSANISSNAYGNASMIIAHAKRASNQYADAKTVEETFTNAAGEITLWVA